MVVATTKQRKIRDHPGLGLLVIAPAGCGKTEALALRVQGILARGDVAAPQRVLVTTFSNRARDNIKERLNAYLPASVMRDRVSVANFHGVSVRIIRAHANVIGLKSELLNDEDVEAELARIENTIASDIERQRKAEERLTYDDLPRLAELILSRPAVAELYRAHFGAVVVDEFQDLTPKQLRIVNHIGHLRTTYGGDLAQGIYGFAGAEPMEVDRAIRGECTTVIEFSESHRSSPAVLGLVNALIPLTSGQPLTAADPASWPSGGLAGSVVHQTAEIEAAWIVRIARALLAHAPNHRIGLIARTAPRRRFVDRAFEHTDVPHFRWDDGVLDTDVAKLVKAMLTRFDLAGYEIAADKIAFLRNAAGIEAIADVDILKATVDALGWVYDLLNASVTPQNIRRRIKTGDASTLVTSAGVHLLSGHVGKGQQFDWVVVVGVEEDFIPFSMADTPDEMTEEARVLSVMISRARHGVILSRATSVPTNAGNSRVRTASRFLTEIDASGPLDEDQIIAWFRTVDWKAVVAR